MAFFREHSRTLSAIIGVNSTSVSIEGAARPLDVRFVTTNFFRELGGGCRFGRPLDPARDERPDAAPVIVLSYGFWQRHFASDLSAVGRALRVNGKPGDDNRCRRERVQRYWSGHRRTCLLGTHHAAALFRRGEPIAHGTCPLKALESVYGDVWRKAGAQKRPKTNYAC